ncbi:MAG TPA: hypothetical protein VFH29_04595 [Anaerolineales bacterium]|nr:hypothetical protein [Anaerolineales bacterium]
MHNARVKFLLSLALMTILITSGCGLPVPGAGGGGGGATAEQPAATLPPADTAAPPTSTAIPHLATPGAGSKAIANAHDNDECKTPDTKSVTVGDEFRINRFERPFTAKDMQYLPQIDIVGMSMTQDDTWYYIQMKMCGKDPATGTMSGNYGAEFDLNVDGKTEVLVLANGPIGTDWSANGVAIYADLNGDIGGASSRPDDIYTGNGYETKVYESGQTLYTGGGDAADPDLAWARASADTATVELAIKKTVLKDYKKWMWNPLASAYPLDPTKMYFNDTFTAERAGSARKGDANYPLNELAGFDNSCRLPANFDAKGDEPMGCNVSKQQKDIEFGGGGGSSS